MATFKEITKELSIPQKRAFIKLTKAKSPKSAYELDSTMTTMEALERRGLVKRLKGNTLGYIFSPTTTIMWKSKYQA